MQFVPATKYQVLVYKTKRTMETRLKHSTRGDSSQGSGRMDTTGNPGSGISASPSQGPQIDDFKTVLNEVKSCEEIDEFIEMYEPGGVVHDCLDCIRASLRASGKSVDEWAEDWAKSLYQDDENAKNLNKYRKLSLELLYTLCNRYKGEKKPQTLTAANVVDDFGDKRIMGIVGLCLPMDRANALYNMMLPGQARPGMHWVSEIHVARDPEWAQRMSNYDGIPTINKRFFWLLEDEALAGLNLRQSNFMRKYTTPVAASISGQT